MGVEDCNREMEMYSRSMRPIDAEHLETMRECLGGLVLQACFKRFIGALCGLAITSQGTVVIGQVAG